MTTSLLVIIMLHFFCDERRICSTIKKSRNNYIMNMIAKFILLFMSLSTALILKIFYVIIFLKKWISVKTYQVKGKF